LADLQLLISALLDGDSEKAITEALSLRDAFIAPEDIVVNGIEVAMAKLDAKCTVDQFNLLEIMLVGRAALGVLRALFPEEEQNTTSKGTVLVAALEGDVHDLGKNIVKAILTCNGYSVVDCGKDCPVNKLVDTAAREMPLAIAISGLITTIAPKVRTVKVALASKGLEKIKVFAGGAALKQFTAENLQVDYVGQTVFDCLNQISAIGRDDNE
jgi:methanogenic corrinoid protein MtbC1